MIKSKRKPTSEPYRTFSVRPETHARLQAVAERRGVAIGKLVEEMLDREQGAAS